VQQLGAMGQGAGERRQRRSKRPRRVLYATATGVGLLAGAIAVSETARHYAEGARRTGRVVGTLAVCINE
jgi:aarF domain-containing kinase